MLIQLAHDRRIKLAVMLVALGLAALFGLPSNAHATVVTFPDANLESAVRDGLAIPRPFPVTDADMAMLDGLGGMEMGIGNLSGLEYATNLEYVYLSHNQIADVTPLTGLTKLTTLDLHSNQIADVTALAGLTNLTNLTLNDNRIVDITALAGLTKLTSLSLTVNQITDITPVSGLTDLASLELAVNQITDITPVSSLANLTFLGLIGNRITDISPLAGMTNLTYLGLMDNRITDISPLAGMTNLDALELDWNRISDVSPLEGLNVGVLSLSGNRITDISPLANMPSLWWVALFDNYLDLTPGSPAMVTIAALETHATVFYAPQKAPVTTVDRFRNVRNGHYLWTGDEAEKASIIANLSQTWKHEGVAYRINNTNPLNSSPLWRFVNLHRGFYLFSADPGERDFVVTTLRHSWRLEGEACQVSSDPSGAPVWRFRNLQDGTYLFTADPAEKDSIVAALNTTWVLEGPAYYLAP